MSSRQRASWWLTPVAVLVGLMMAAPVAAKPRGSGRQSRVEKLDPDLKNRAGRLLGTTPVIITVEPGQEDNAIQELKKLGVRVGKKLSLVNGVSAELPNRLLETLAGRSEVVGLHYDRPITPHMNRAAATVGARIVRDTLGFDGAGVGVAVIDSGITNYHDDLTYSGTSTKVRVVAGQRMTAFVDFVNHNPVAYDDNGHGTHVAGIIAGNGFDSGGARAGIAPGAHLVSLKVLDGEGRGVISNVISAFEWAVTNRASHNIRVINLSVGARVAESYTTDPLTIAAKRATDVGIVVVTAAGNLGRKSTGATQYGGITAPGNAPWVLTVGASSTEGTVTRSDDVIAGYSSRGPTAVDYEAKPDLVAPGTGIVSLSDPTSTFYQTKSAYLLDGTHSTSYKPYLSLSGTSMASPVVAGTVALMMQANPRLTPNLVKAILQYTAQRYQYDTLTQGAGFLNTHGAVELARFYFKARVGDRIPSSGQWSKQINWGNYRITGGVIKPNGTAWALNIVWGTMDDGENIVWGTQCGTDCENIVWGTADEDENIVWGTIEEGENIVWGTYDDGENIVWGTADDVENIVWGTNCDSNDCENIVWGTALDLENVVWGTALDDENIVWGTSGSPADGEDVTWASSGEDITSFDEPNADPITYDGVTLEELFGPPPPTAPSGSTTTTAAMTGGVQEGGF